MCGTSTLHTSLQLKATHHAQARVRQRGVRDETVALVAEFGDREVELGSGHTAVSVSAKALAKLREHYGSALAERTKGLILILADGKLVTVMHALGKRSRRYRTGMA